MTPYETFEIEAGGGSSGLLSAGRILRALARGAAIPSEEVGAIGLSGGARHGVAQVEIAEGRAAFLTTPRYLPSDEGGKPTLFMLRRADDLPDEGRAELLLSPEAEDAPLPRPGEAAIALADALGIGAEELGFSLEGAGFVRISVPLEALTGPVPTSIGIAGRRFQIENLAKKS